jgi:N-methylhydantoinase B
MTGVITPSIEMTEVQYPIRILKHEYLADTTGAGQWRGAPGLETIAQFRVTSHASVMMAGVENTTRGFAGAADGAPNRVVLCSTPRDRTEVPEVAFKFEMGPGGTIETIRGGGGGWGDPLLRDPEAVQRDVLDGYVTRAAALREYGVVLDRDGAADVEGTMRERTARS